MRRYTAIVFLLAGILQSGMAQQQAPSGSVHGSFSIGVGGDLSKDVGDVYDELAQNIRSFGIPLRTQTKFGRTMAMSADVLYNRFPSIGIGFSVGYSYSPAFSEYEDNAGSMSLNGSKQVYTICLKARATPERFGKFPFILNMQFGACHTVVSITQKVRFINVPSANADWNLFTNTWGPYFQMTVGTSINLFGDFSLGAEGGLDYGFTKVPNAELDPMGTAKDQLGKELGPFGFVFLLSVGV